MRPLGHYEAPATTRGRPAVITWYRIYAVTTPLFYLLAFALWQLRVPAIGDDRTFHLGIAAIVVLTALFAVAAMVPYKPWGWTFALIAIGIGLPTCLAPFALPLILFWLRPETRAAFCRL
jgi:hypothetical protein